jgi:hypothetical protein
MMSWRSLVEFIAQLALIGLATGLAIGIGFCVVRTTLRRRWKVVPATEAPAASLKNQASWHVDAQGNLVVDQVTGFHVVPAIGTAVVARIEFQSRSEEGETSAGQTQLAMSPAIALQLSDDLAKTAGHILSSSSPGRAN